MLAMIWGFHPKSRSKPIPPKFGRIGSVGLGLGERHSTKPCETGGSGLKVTTIRLASSLVHVSPVRTQLLQGAQPSQLFFSRRHLAHAAPGARRFGPVRCSFRRSLFKVPGWSRSVPKMSSCVNLTCGAGTGTLELSFSTFILSIIRTKDVLCRIPCLRWRSAMDNAFSDPKFM
eukprot:558352-Rhodomonas_salina.3